MKNAVLVASRHAAEAEAIVAALAPEYVAHSIAQAEALVSGAGEALGIVLDSNYSDYLGIDVLTEVLERTQVPVLMLTPPEDPHWAVEAMRCGAAGYLVKTANYVDLVSVALRELIARFNREDELKRTIVDLRKRLAEAEGRGTRRAQDDGALPANAATSDRARLLGEAVRRLRSEDPALPAYPDVARKYRQIAAKEDVSATELARLLECDAAISVRLLRLANSAAYARGSPVQSIEQAVAYSGASVTRLGIAVVGNLVELVANRSLYACANRAYKPMLDHLWQHSLASAHASQSLARNAGLSGHEPAFSLGLLHDVGRLALVQVLAEMDAAGKCIASIENLREFEAFSDKLHCRLGAAVLTAWKFDQTFQQIALHHENPEQAPSLTKELFVVHLGARVAHATFAQPAQSTSGGDELENSPAARFLGLNADCLQSVQAEVHSAIASCRSVLG